MKNKEYELTPFQVELYKWTIQGIKNHTFNFDPTLMETLNLMAFIKEFELLETTNVIVPQTGKMATKEQKFMLWFRQNSKDIQQIFNLAD